MLIYAIILVCPIFASKHFVIGEKTMKCPTLIYPERDNGYGDKETHVFYSIKPVIDRFMVIDFNMGVLRIRPMCDSTIDNMLTIIAGCFEKNANVGSELAKIYGEETQLAAIKLELNNASVMVNSENRNSVVFLGQKTEDPKCEKEMADNATPCRTTANYVG